MMSGTNTDSSLLSETGLQTTNPAMSLGSFPPLLTGSLDDEIPQIDGLDTSHANSNTYDVYISTSGSQVRC